jgi:hypothetical protein
VDFNTSIIQQLYLRQKSSSYVRDVRYFRPILETSEKHPFRPGQFVVYCFFEPKRGQSPAWVISIGLAFHIGMWRTCCCSLQGVRFNPEQPTSRIDFENLPMPLGQGSTPCYTHTLRLLLSLQQIHWLAIAHLCAVEKRQTLQYIRKFNRRPGCRRKMLSKAAPITWDGDSFGPETCPINSVCPTKHRIQTNLL